VYDVIDPYNSSSDAVELTLEEDLYDDELEGCRLVSEVKYFGDSCDEYDDDERDDDDADDDDDASSQESDDEQRLRLDDDREATEALSHILESYIHSDCPYKLWEKLDTWDAIECYVPEQDIYGMKAPSGSIDEHGDMVSLRIGADICDEIFMSRSRNVKQDDRARASERNSPVGQKMDHEPDLSLMTEICVSEDESGRWWDDSSSLGQSSFSGTPRGLGGFLDYTFFNCDTPKSKSSIGSMSRPSIRDFTTCTVQSPEEASQVGGSKTHAVIAIPKNDILRSIDAVVAYHNGDGGSDVDEEDSIDWELLQSAVRSATMNIQAHELIRSGIPVLQGIGLSLLLHPTPVM
jgi:hypothetical protein